MANEIHVGDVGTRLTATFKDSAGAVFDISTATTKVISIENEAGVAIEAAGTFTTDGTDGKLYADSIVAHFATPGLHQLQARVQFASGKVFRSQQVQVRVFSNNAAPA